MAELHVVEDERPGMLKEIDDGAMDLIFQAIQEDIYSFPIKSFIRESISNGLDAIVERNIFFAINAGAPIENYFLQRQDNKLLKDSAYTPEYYDTKYLSSNHKVEVTYREGHPRDTISIKDNGVGLGSSRLKGFFKLGYSSKRNMKDVIGKFGAGAKAGLATGVEYFIMHTTYNGYRTSFMIFKNDYENITPQSESAKVDVWEVKMSNGSVSTREIYWTPSTEKNGVQIDLEVKKHNKTLFLEAVTQQFQYFDGKVSLRTIDDSGNSSTDTLDATPEYESKALLIPKYSTYNSPHILVDGISYGLISWDELELERRQGKIAIKVAATDVDITQSRESLKWTEKTKNTILQAITTARLEAENHIASLLTIKDTADLLSINRLYGSLGKGSGDSVGATFSTFLDMHNLSPSVSVQLTKDTAVTGYLSAPFFEFLFNGLQIKKLTLSNYQNKTKINSSRVDNFIELRGSKIIYADSSSVGPKLVAHLLQKWNVDSLVYVRPFTDTNFEGSFPVKYNKTELTAKEVRDYSIELFKKYGDLFIDDYDVIYTEEKEEDLEKEVEVSKETAAHIRKMNKQILYTIHTDIQLDYSLDFSFKQVRIPVKIGELKNTFSSDREVVICTGSYANLGRMIEVSSIAFPKNPVLVIYVAQDVVHHFAPYGTLITDYFRTVNLQTGKLMIGKHIRNLNTWRMFYQLLRDYPEFSKNTPLLEAFTTIDIQQYKELRYNAKDITPKDMIKNGGNIGNAVLDEVFQYLEGLKVFQNVVQTADKDKIAAKALELFKSDEIYNIDAYDETFITHIKEEFERLAPIRDILTLMNENGDFKASKHLIDLLITTLNTQNDGNI